MNSEPELKYYTIADLRQWLLHNKPKEGLSEKIIAPQRAYAIMNNPYVKDSDAVVSAIFEGGEPAAYTAAFPEILEKPKGKLAWWFSTLYCRPESEGKGYGLIVVGQLCELIGEGNYFDMDGATETVEIFDILGLSCSYIKRYVFNEKHYMTNTLRGRLAYVADWYNRVVCGVRKSRFSNLNNELTFNLRYSNYINDETYNFILKHSTNDLFLREQKCLNWILQYPFMISSPVISRVKFDIRFSSNVRFYQNQVVTVFYEDIVIGVYMYRMLDREFSLLYIYYDDAYCKEVFSSVVYNFINLKAICLKTTNATFANWFNVYGFTRKMIIYKQSFSYPYNSFVYNGTSFVQLGDGDVFV